MCELFERSRTLESLGSEIERTFTKSGEVRAGKSVIWVKDSRITLR